MKATEVYTVRRTITYEVEVPKSFGTETGTSHRYWATRRCAVSHEEANEFVANAGNLVALDSRGQPYPLYVAGHAIITVESMTVVADETYTRGPESDGDEAEQVDNRLECVKCHTRDGVRVRVLAPNVQPRLCERCNAEARAEAR